MQSLPLNEAVIYWRERIRSAARLALFLDFDGTISPIVGTPDRAAIDPQIKSILEHLRDSGTIDIAVVSGRQLSDVRARAGIEGIMYAGNHGLEIETRDLCFREPGAENLRLELRRLVLRLQSLLADTSGVGIENKGLSVAVHYRQVHPALHEWVRSSIAETVCKSHVFTCIFGKMVVDIRPKVEWNKGNAVKWILDRLAKGSAYPIVIGDDATDEDAFRALHSEALTIHVGAPDGTAARFWVSDLHGVRRFLAEIEASRGASKHP
jgi:trehalose-phosphatase